MSGYKSTNSNPIAGRLLLAGIILIGLLAGSFFLGRVTKTTTTDATDTQGIYINQQGVPAGFAPTARGAGEAAAKYLGFLSAKQTIPRDELRKLFETLVTEDAHGLVENMMPSPITEGNPGISQETMLRVWVDTDDPHRILAEGAEINVKTYSVVLIGSSTNGTTVDPDWNLAGGFWVQDSVMRLEETGWRIADIDGAVRITPPHISGAKVLDDLGIDALAELAGPDSWVPGAHQ